MFSKYKDTLLSILYFSKPPHVFCKHSWNNTKSNNPKISSLGWILLIIPTSSFALGTWQVKRKKWKESLIADLKKRTNSDPTKLPHSLQDIETLEYYPVHVKGKFLHEQELYMGPRMLISNEVDRASSLISNRQTEKQGFLVITPFKLAGEERTILINRGWVPSKTKNPSSRLRGQVEGEVDVIGIVRLQENRPPFIPAIKPETNFWPFRDVNLMSKIRGTDPIFLDATNDCNIEGGPISGQTRVVLRNEHLSYIITWYTLSLITGLMWYSKFVKGISL